MTKTIRIATNKKYIVQRMEFPSSGPAKVHCWGELVYMKGLRTKHEASKCFLASAVTVAEVIKTVALERELFEQAVQAKRDAGFDITKNRTGSKVTYTKPSNESAVTASDFLGLVKLIGKM